MNELDCCWFNLNLFLEAAVCGAFIIIFYFLFLTELYWETSSTISSIISDINEVEKIPETVRQPIEDQTLISENRWLC